MEDYPKDPMGYEPSTVTPANQENGKVKEELTVEPALLDIKEEVKKEQDDEVSISSPSQPD